MSASAPQAHASRSASVSWFATAGIGRAPDGGRGRARGELPGHAAPFPREDPFSRAATYELAANTFDRNTIGSGSPGRRDADRSETPRRKRRIRWARSPTSSTTKAARVLLDTIGGWQDDLDCVVVELVGEARDGRRFPRCVRAAPDRRLSRGRGSWLPRQVPGT